MEIINSVLEIIKQNIPENIFLQFLYFCFLGIFILFIYRFLMHLVIRLVSWKETSSQPFKIYFDKDYDYINGWRKKKEDDDNGDG